MNTLCAKLARLGLLCGFVLLAGCPPAGNGSGSGAHQAQLAAGGTVRLPLEIALDDPVLKALDFTDSRLYALARCLEYPLVDRQLGEMTGTVFTAATADPAQTEWNLTLRAIPGHENESDYAGRLISERFKEILRGPVSPLREQLADLLVGAADFRDGRALEISGLSGIGADFTMRFTRTNVALAAWLTQPGLGLMPVRTLPGAGGYGPFILAAVEGSELVLKPNPASLLGTPHLSELRFVCEPDRTRQLALFREGQLDAANLALSDLAAVAADEQLASQTVQLATAEQILGCFNLSRFPWGDSEFRPKQGLRQAVNWGINRADLQSMQQEQLVVWQYFLPQTMREYVPPELIAKPTYPPATDAARAMAGLITADHEQGSKLLPGMDLGYLESAHLEQLATEILTYWDDISVRMHPFPMRPDELALRLERRTHEIVLNRMRPAYADPDALTYPLLLSKFGGIGGNWSDLSNPAVDELVLRTQSTTDRITRVKCFHNLLTLLDEQALFVFIGSATPTVLLSPQLGGYTLTPNDFDASLPAQDFAKLGRWED